MIDLFYARKGFHSLITLQHVKEVFLIISVRKAGAEMPLTSRGHPKPAAGERKGHLQVFSAEPRAVPGTVFTFFK